MTRTTRIFLCFFFLIYVANVAAQSNHSNDELKEMTFGERLYFGGMLGGSIGTITSLQVMPVVGYRLMHRWSAGVGVNYQYYQYTRPPSFDTHIYGGNIHTRVYIWDHFFAHSEFEVLSMEVIDNSIPDYTRRRVAVPALFVGAGYFMPIGQRSGFAITFLYDLIRDTYSPYPGNFVLRMGFAL